MAGPCSFAAALKPALLAIEAELCRRFGADHGVDIFAYLDDLTAVTEEGRAEEIIEIVSQAMRAVGLKSKPSKMTVWTQSGHPPPGVEAARAWNAQTHHDGLCAPWAATALWRRRG